MVEFTKVLTIYQLSHTWTIMTSYKRFVIQIPALLLWFLGKVITSSYPCNCSLPCNHSSGSHPPSYPSFTFGHFPWAKCPSHSAFSLWRPCLQSQHHPNAISSCREDQCLMLSLGSPPFLFPPISHSKLYCRWLAFEKGHWGLGARLCFPAPGPGETKPLSGGGKQKDKGKKGF
jgi:hypothetical protein